MARTLKDRAALIRSKNAGPFVLSVDVVFRSREDLDAVVDLDVLNPDAISRVYGIDPSLISVHVYPAGLAIKVTMPRVAPSGSPEDADMYGAQQHGPILDLPA